MSSAQLAVPLRTAGELFVRTARIRSSLERIENTESEGYRQLVDTLRAALGEIEARVVGTLEFLVPIEGAGDLHEVELEALEFDLDQFSRWFTKLHEFLVYFPSETVRPETPFVLESAFGDLYRQHKPTIILGSIFNALEFDFLELLENRLPSFGALRLDRGANTVLQLPLCDRSTPVAWAVLAHEMAHTIDKDMNISEEVAAEIVKAPGSGAFLLVRNWARELCADLIAAHFLGVAPILALVGFEYCVLPQANRYFPSSTHPSTHWRVAVVLDYLARQGSDVEVWEGERVLFKKAVEYSLQMHEPDPPKRQTLKTQNKDQFTNIIRPVSDALGERVRSLGDGCTSLNEASLLRCLKRLEADLPISAQGASKEELNTALDEYKAQGFEEESLRVAAFQELAERFNEEPMSVATILAAAQASRCQMMEEASSGLEMLAAAESRAKWVSRVAQIDDLVAGSISMTSVHQVVLEDLSNG